MGAFLAAAPIISQAQLSGVGSTITVGTVFTYNGQEFTIVTPPDPNYQTEPTSERTLETNAFIALRNAGISFTLNGTVYSIDEAIANGLLAVSKHLLIWDWALFWELVQLPLLKEPEADAVNNRL